MRAIRNKTAGNPEKMSGLSGMAGRIISSAVAFRRRLVAAR
jgi:hypothetical protein